MSKNKIISFSLWGNGEHYFNGCIENIHLAKKIYPGWKVRFYCDDQIKEDFLNNLRGLGAQVVLMKTVSNPWEGLFWRFLPASEPDVDIFISRDIDSRLNVREKAAVDEWVMSDKKLHSMRDHIEHNVPILGGMWGSKRGLLNDMKELIDLWQNKGYKGSDQDFLREKIWSVYKDKAMVHDRFSNGLIINNGKTEENLFVPPEIPVDEYGAVDPYFVIPEMPEYFYNPILFFGDHYIRTFPIHGPMEYGTYVGEIIR